MAVKLETIKKRKEFLDVANRGKRILGDFFIVQKYKTNPEQKTRFGFTITKKVAKRAVVRNLMKRRMKEAVRKLDGIVNGYDIVIVMRARILGASFQQIEESLKKQITIVLAGDK